MSSVVYVDTPIWPYGRMLMCHMFSLDLEALHQMADKIGVQRKWFQDPTRMHRVSWPHYDIAKTKRRLAIEHGAVEVDKYQMIAVAVLIKNKHFALNEHPLRRFAARTLPDGTEVPQHGEHDRLRAWLLEQGLIVT